MNPRNQVRGRRTGFSHSGAEVEEYPTEKVKQTKVVHVNIIAEASHASAEKFMDEIGSQRTLLP